MMHGIVQFHKFYLLLMMVWLIAHNAKSPVKLFHKEHANHLMRESHFRQGYLLIGSIVNLW